MKTPARPFNFKAPAALIDAANAVARQNYTTLSAVLRQYLAMYAAAPRNGTK